MSEDTHNHLASFHRGDLDIALPFFLDINGQRYNCSKVLRLLPAKRLVVKAESKGKFYVIKLFSNAQKGQRELKREQSGFEQVTRSGVNTPKLAFFDSDTEGCSLIAYQYLTDLQTFNDDPNNINKYKKKLVKLIAKLHQAGIYQDDFHLDNILISKDKLFLIDLASIEVEAKNTAVSREVSLANLAKLIVQFVPKQQKKIVKRLRKYYTQRDWSWNEEEKKRSKQYIHQAWQKRKTLYLKKRFRSCTMTFYKHNFQQQTAFRRSFINAVGQDFIGDIEQLVQGGDLLKDGNSATVVKVRYGDKQLVIKRYNIKSVWHLLKRCYRPSRAAVSWRNANLLELLGIPTPKTLGFIEQRVGPFRKTAYLVCEYSDGQELIDAYQSRMPTEPELAQLKTIFSVLRRYKISHGDLKASNLLITQDGEISLIDLDAMQEHCSDSTFQKAYAKDQQRFLKNWQQSAPELCTMLDAALFNNS